jgi:anthranilate 1,2-dioxygenase large subunit
MEDTEATELVQRGTARDGDLASVIEMSRAAPDEQGTLITESLIRRFWVGYQTLMGFAAEEPAS